MSVANRRGVLAWVIDPEGSEQALAEVGETLRGSTQQECLVFYFTSTLSSVAQLEDWCALKNMHMAQLLLQFIVQDEPQELPINFGTLNETKLRELIHAFAVGRHVERFRLIGAAEPMRGAQTTLQSLGFAQASIAGDGVAPAPPVSGSAAAAPVPGRCQVTVIVDGRSRRFGLDGDDTVLEAGERAGIALPYSCRSGVCATCRTRVVSGSVEMAQNFALEDWELAAGFILACQSRPVTAELTITYDEK